MFLAFWLLDETKSAAAHVALVVFRHIFLLINKFIYQFIVFAYNIFIRLSNGQLLNSKEINELFGRLALIIGLLMLFRVAIGFIQLLIEPDSISDSKKGLTGIVKKIILVIIMLGMSTYLFNLLTNIQVAVIKSNIIPKLLLPYEINDTDFGKTLSGNLFNSFIYEIGDVNAAKECTKENYKVAQKEVLVEQNFEYMGVCIDEYDDDKNEFIYEYNFLFSTLVGIAAAWFVFSYCVSVGVRLIQLTVLQIISPIGIIGYLSPKDETLFTNWLKKYMGTYLDIFIRLIIINFAVYLIALIFSGYGDKSNVFWGSIGETSSILEAAYIKIIMILAILSFAKKAPDLIKSLFPSGMLDSGIGFGLDSTANKFGLGALGVGALAGGTAASFAANKTARFREGLANAQGFTGKLDYLKNGVKGIPGGVKGRISNSLNTLTTNAGNFRRASLGKKAGMIFNGIGRGAQTLGRTAGRGARVLQGTYQTGRASANSKNPIEAIKEGYSYSPNSNNSLAGLKRIDELISDDGKVKDAKTYYNAQVEKYGAFSPQADSAKMGIDSAKKLAWDSDIVKAGVSAVYKRTGQQFNSYDEFKNALDAAEVKKAGQWKPDKK